jgi:hypothetical protein
MTKKIIYCRVILSKSFFFQQLQVLKTKQQLKSAAVCRREIPNPALPIAPELYDVQRVFVGRFWT